MVPAMRLFDEALPRRLDYRRRPNSMHRTRRHSRETNGTRPSSSTIGRPAESRAPTWILSTIVVAASIGLATILPAQPTPTSPVPELKLESFAQSEIGNDFNVDLAILGAAPLSALAVGPLMVSLPAITDQPDPVGVASRYISIPGQALTIRTGSSHDLPDPVYSLPVFNPDARTPSPPYTTSKRGSYETRLAYRTGTIERSLFEDGRDAGLSDPLIAKLAQIFGWDIDFALDLREGDSFVVIYEEKFWFGRKVAEGPILAAEFSNRGRVYRAIGVKSRDGKITYYTPAGVSLRRPFLRTPVQFSNVTSLFSQARYHPILKTWRAHNGVDYAAPTGTPVRATASGRVVSIGWNGGYGNSVLIQHSGPYSTLYAHLSAYRTGLQTGQHVDQGEVIGYVGQTGLATGPHLHYELQVYGQYRNPLTFRLPPGEMIAPASHEEFMEAAKSWMSRLDLITRRYIASR